MCEGWSLEIGHAFRGSVVRQDKFDGPSMWLASVNAAYLGEYLEREAAMARVQAEIESNTWNCCCTIGGSTSRQSKSKRPTHVI